MTNMNKYRISFALTSAAFLLAQTGTIDFVQGVKNKPELDPRSYVFTRTNGSGASGTLTSAGSGKTATLTPCPAGITAASISNSYIRISGGTGTAEAVKITNYSASGANCTLTFTTVNTHSGSWIIGPNGNGLQEALVDAAAQSRAVHLVAGTYTVYAPIYVPAYATLRGDGKFVSILQAQTASTGILDASGTNNTFADFGMTNLSNAQGTSGNYGIRLGVSTENNFSTFTRLFSDFLYDTILSVNAAQIQVTDCTLWDPSHTSIILQDTAAPDNVGGQIINNNFFSYALATPAEAFILIHSTSSNLISNNNMIGGASQINYCIENDSTTSGGWLAITGNKCEAPLLHGFNVTGEWTQLAITGNTIANTAGGGVINWTGIAMIGSSGAGIYRAAITGNVIQCGSTGNNGIFMGSTYSNVGVFGNNISGCAYGVSANGSPTSVTVGPNNIQGSTSSNGYAASTGVVFDLSCSMTYAQMTSTVAGIGNAGNGSRTFCSDCNSTCTAGSSNGRYCYKENGAWTH